MDRKRIYGISQDAPTYFQTSRYTELQPLPHALSSSMGVKSALHTSVSSEAPDAFHIKYSSVVFPGTRRALMASPRAAVPLPAPRSSSDIPAPGFRYEDLQDHKGAFLDQTTVKPTTLIDLLIGKNTSQTYKLPYYQEYQAALRNQGFAKRPGEFSKQASQKEMIRRDGRVLQKLQNSLNQSKASLAVEKKTKAASSDVTVTPSHETTARKPKVKSPSPEARTTQSEINDFERRLEQQLKLPPLIKTSQEKWRWQD